MRRAVHQYFKCTWLAVTSWKGCSINYALTFTRRDILSGHATLLPCLLTLQCAEDGVALEVQVAIQLAPGLPDVAALLCCQLGAIPAQRRLTNRQPAAVRHKNEQRLVISGLGSFPSLGGYELYRLGRLPGLLRSREHAGGRAGRRGSGPGRMAGCSVQCVQLGMGA